MTGNNDGDRIVSQRLSNGPSCLWSPDSLGEIPICGHFAPWDLHNRHQNIPLKSSKRSDVDREIESGSLTRQIGP